MPAKLPYPVVKPDINIWRDDYEFLQAYLASKNYTVAEIVRELTHRYANSVRAQMGLTVTPPHPPGKLP